MALRCTLDSPKTIALANTLNIPRCFAVGIAELCFHITADYAPDGRIGRLSNKLIAAMLEWDGDPDELERAMVEAGIWARHPVHRLIVCEWDLALFEEWAGPAPEKAVR